MMVALRKPSLTSYIIAFEGYNSDPVVNASSLLQTELNTTDRKWNVNTVKAGLAKISLSLIVI